MQTKSRRSYSFFHISTKSVLRSVDNICVFMRDFVKSDAFFRGNRFKLHIKIGLRKHDAGKDIFRSRSF